MGVDVRGLLEELHAAVRQVVRSGNESQLTAAASIRSRRGTGLRQSAR